MDKPTKYKWGIFITFFVAIAYLIVPVDIVPDAVPLLGWIDDIVAVLLAVANAIRLVQKIKNH